MNVYYKMHNITVVVASHIFLMYLVADANNKLAIAHKIVYYISLFITTYAVEFCAMIRKSQHNVLRELCDDHILIPFVGIPLAFTSIFIVGFTIYNIITALRVLVFVGSASILYFHHKNATCLIPLAISYVPIVATLIHINVIAGSILLVNYNSKIFLRD